MLSQIRGAKLAQRIGQVGHDDCVGRLSFGQTCEQVQRIDVLGWAKLRADEMHVAGGGADVAVAHQSLNGDQIDATFE